MDEAVIDGMVDLFHAMRDYVVQNGTLPEGEDRVALIDEHLGLTEEEFDTLRAGLSDDDRLALARKIVPAEEEEEEG